MYVSIPLRRSLRRTQRRRKAVIRIAAGLVLPLVLVANAQAAPDSVWRQAFVLFGLLLIVLGLLGRAWCTLYIAGRKAKVLVTHGPYSVSRNPLYLFSFMATAGLGAQTGSVSLTLLALLGSWLIFWPVIAKEEEVLATRFPDDYPRYAAEVPRLLPNFGRWEDSEHLQVESRLLRRTVLDSLVWVALVPVVRLINLLHETAVLPVWITLP